MDFNKILGDNTLVICNNSIKRKILDYLNTIPNLYSINFMSMNEVKKHLFFDYDKKTIHYMMNKNMPYEVAEILIKNMYYVEDKEYGNSKLDDLVKYKKELDENGLLIKDNLFINMIKGKKIVAISKSLSKFDEYILSILKKYTTVEIYPYEYKEYKHKVYEFSTIEKEIEFVAYSICELINKGVDINNIKISNIDEDYINGIKRIFGYFNIPINMPSNSYLIGTKIASIFLSNYDSDISKSLESIKEYEGNDIYNMIVDICNKYTFVSDYNDVKDMIIHDLSNKLVPSKKYKNAVEIVDYKDVSDEYVFLMNFNLKSIPKVYKDEDYITDNIKPEYMDSTTLKNKKEKDLTIKSINNIENMVITYKMLTPTSECYPSNLVSDMEVECPKIDIYKSYSKINDKLKLAASLDRLLMYGNKDEDINALKYNYEIPYLKYDNKYKKIDIDNLYKIASKLSFSYSNVEQYYECPFKYYLNNILKLNIYEENFSAILGTIFHHILEIGVDKDIDVDKEITLFLTEKYPDRVFSKKETFFIENAKENIRFVLDEIKKQMQFCKLNGIEKERRVFISKDKNMKITFTGVIDKLLYREDDDKTIVAIIDYKTGNSVDIDMSYMKDGIGLQLPIYILLTKNMSFKNIKFAGIYLQKVMPDIEKVGDKETREDKLKLEGYSNSNKDILSELDLTYTDSSVIKGMSVTKEGRIKSKKILSDEEFDSLAILAEQKIDECIDNVLSGNFDIIPAYNGKELVGCKYCKYKDICFKTYRDKRDISKEDGGEDNE